MLKEYEETVKQIVRASVIRKKHNLARG